MRNLTAACLCLLVGSSPSSASGARADAPLWGALEPGDHDVGFRAIDRVDFARVWRTPRDLDGKPRAGERARPMKIGVWYPAKAAPGARAMTLGDYVALLGGERRAGRPDAAATAAARDAFYAGLRLGEVTPDQRRDAEALSGRAVRDAAPAAGRFPLVLYSLGSAALGHVTPEYLASHGYVVVQMPRLGAFAGLPDTGGDRADFQAKARDLDFIHNVAAELPFVDPHTVAVIGFSAGGRWALAKAMRDPDVRAVVSLDSVMLFDDAPGKAFRGLSETDLDRVRVPVLHMIRDEWVGKEDAKIWDQLRHADRTALRFQAGLDHLDFQSIGRTLSLARVRAEKARDITTAFELENRYTLAFLDAHVRGDAAARALLARSPAENGAPPGFVTVARAVAEPAPLDLADFMGAVDDRGVDAAVAAFERAQKSRGGEGLPEPMLNLTAYTLLGSGSARDALRLFELNVANHPRSANAWDSLADGYLATGDRKRAGDAARRAIELLASDPSPAERKQAIRDSAEQKLK